MSFLILCHLILFALFLPRIFKDPFNPSDLREKKQKNMDAE